MVLNYLKIAIRNLQRNKTFSFINIVGLSFGIACTLLIGLWIKDELGFDNIHTDQSRLYRVLANVTWGELSTFTSMPGPLNAALKKDFPEIEFATSISESQLALSNDNLTFVEKGYYASPDILKMFSFPLEHGDPATVLSAPNSIILTKSTARKYFGDVDPVGKSIDVEIELKKTPYKITGVITDIPTNSTLQFNWIISFEDFERQAAWSKTWGNYAFQLYIMLSPTASTQLVNEKLLHYLKKAKQPDATEELFLQSFSDVHLYNSFSNGRQDGGRILYVRMFMIIAAFIILIACINFMNLTTARYTRRMKEVGVRKVNGASRNSLMCQFLGEAIFSTVISVAFAVVLATLLLPLFNMLTEKNLVIGLDNIQVVGALLLLTLFIGLFAGSYPAFFLSSFKPASIFKGKLTGKANTAVLRKALVIVQFSLAILLGIGTMTVYRQIIFIKNKSLGIDKENIITLMINKDIYEHREAFQNRLKQAAGIQSVTVSSNSPISIDGASGDLNWSNKAPDQMVSISAAWVGEDYVKTMGIPLIAGRDFSDNLADTTSYVINESAVKLMGLGDPIGETVTFWQGKGKIIGVLKDFHLRSLYEPITPLILSYQPANCEMMLIRAASGRTEDAIASIKKEYNALKSAYPISYSFLDDEYAKRYKSEMVTGQLINILAIVAIGISCLGLFGLAAFTAEQRTKEIGIRKAMGASIISIIRLLTKDFVVLVAVAFVIISPLAWYLADRWLQNFAYHTSIDISIFVIAGAAAVGIALLTIGMQTIRAASANPTESLRAD